MIRRIAMLAALALFLPLLEGCIGCTHVDPGHVGIEIDSCSGAGVEPKVASVGYQTTGLAGWGLSEFVDDAIVLSRLAQTFKVEGES